MWNGLVLDSRQLLQNGAMLQSVFSYSTRRSQKPYHSKDILQEELLCRRSHPARDECLVPVQVHNTNFKYFVIIDKPEHSVESSASFQPQFVNPN